MNLKHLMVDVKAQGEACFSSWFLPLAGWACFSLKVHILSLINLTTHWIFWQASLFSPIISPIMDHVVHSPTLRTQYLELRSIWTYSNDFVAVLIVHINRQIKYSIIKICCIISNSFGKLDSIYYEDMNSFTGFHYKYFL